jgi:hypothetical protein
MGDISSKLVRPSGRVKGVAEAACIGYYHPVRAGHQDRVSASLRKFIEGSEPHLWRWIELATERAVAGLTFYVIVRALRHDEVSADGTTPLDKLCDSIASTSGKPYVPHRVRKKRATRPLEDLGGKAARLAEMDGVLRFDGSSIKEDARILVVDTMLWTGASVEAMARAIHERLPKAEVVAFVLMRADSTSNNAHLNPDYFEGTSTDPVGVPGKPRKDRAAAARAKDAAPVASSSEPAQSDPVPARRFRVPVSTFLIGGLAIVFLVIGALVPLRSSKKPPGTVEPLVEPFEVTPPESNPAPPPPASHQPARVEAPAYPQGFINVPDAGLRQSASLSARMVGKVRLRNGEQVSIMKKHKPDFGPTWMQVKTKSGKVGWVFASVVKEKKSGKR